jgi:hypothetical protein
MQHGERNAVIEPLIMVPLINSLLANPLLSLYKTGFDHPGGRGELVNMGTDDPCPVVFHILVPVNLTACPYLTFTSIGVHNHPPPPPNTLPTQVVDSLVGVVRNMNQPGMTLGRVDYCKSQCLIRLIRDRTATFLKSPQLQEFCNQNNSQTLSGIHPSFANMDRFAAIIHKQRLLAYPAGQWYQGVLFEMEINPDIREYDQQVEQDEEGLMIVCVFGRSRFF